MKFTEAKKLISTKEVWFFPNRKFIENFQIEEIAPKPFELFSISNMSWATLRWASLKIYTWLLYKNIIKIIIIDYNYLI